jgi:hypothetical protein
MKEGSQLFTDITAVADLSARKTGTPFADSCSAINCRVLVLPVPVAPATSP